VLLSRRTSARDADVDAVDWFTHPPTPAGCGVGSRLRFSGDRLIVGRPPKGRRRTARKPKETAMTEFSYDHVHLRSPDPNETARYYHNMFGAEIIKSVQSDGRERVDMKLGGVMMFIAQVEPDQALAAKPAGSYVGLDHLGLRVRNIDAVAAELKAKGAEFTVEPKTIRPGVRIAFVRGPQNVLIEILDRDVA
jgi:lactoylglutathione lyase